MYWTKISRVIQVKALRSTVSLLAIGVFVATVTACAIGSSRELRSTRSTSTKAASSKPARSLVMIDAKTGALDLSFPDAYGATSVIADGSGGWYVGGSIKRVGETARNGLAHLSSDGSLDPAFVPDMPRHDLVYSTLLHRNELFAGCDTLGVIAFDARTGKRLWRVSTKGGRVTSLAYWKGVLFVGGAFERIGGVRRSGIAAIDPTTGKPTSWHVKTSAMAVDVAVENGVVYIGGGFDNIGGKKRPLGLAAVSARTGRLTAWAPRLKGAGSLDSVDSVFVTHGQVLAGSVDYGFAAFSTRTGDALRWPERLLGSAWVFAVSSDTVFLAGIADAPFNRAGGKPAHSLASVVLPEGRFTNWRPNLGNCPGFYGLGVSGRKVLAAGYFWEPGDNKC